MSKQSVTNIDRLIGKRIQLRRKELGLTASVLSEKIGIAQQQLSRYERGDNKINVSHLVEIATVLKTSISWFFLDCISEETITTNHYTFIPVMEDEIIKRLNFHLEHLTVDERRGLLIFLDSLAKNNKQ